MNKTNNILEDEMKLNEKEIALIKAFRETKEMPESVVMSFCSSLEKTAQYLEEKQLTDENFIRQLRERARKFKDSFNSGFPNQVCI